jgi:LysM repeat protein
MDIGNPLDYQLGSQLPEGLDPQLVKFLEQQGFTVEVVKENDALLGYLTDKYRNSSAIHEKMPKGTAVDTAMNWLRTPAAGNFRSFVAGATAAAFAAGVGAPNNAYAKNTPGLNTPDAKVLSISAKDLTNDRKAPIGKSAIRMPVNGKLVADASVQKPSKETKPKPPEKKAETPTATHTIKQGENLWRIASEKLTQILGKAPSVKEVEKVVNELVEVNPEITQKNKGHLFVGQVLKLPKSLQAADQKVAATETQTATAKNIAQAAEKADAKKIQAAEAQAAAEKAANTHKVTAAEKKEGINAVLANEFPGLFPSEKITTAFTAIQRKELRDMQKAIRDAAMVGNNLKSQKDLSDFIQLGSPLKERAAQYAQEVKKMQLEVEAKTKLGKEFEVKLGEIWATPAAFKKILKYREEKTTNLDPEATKQFDAALLKLLEEFQGELKANSTTKSGLDAELQAILRGVEDDGNAKANTIKDFQKYVKQNIYASPEAKAEIQKQVLELVANLDAKETAELLGVLRKWLKTNVSGKGFGTEEKSIDAIKQAIAQHKFLTGFQGKEGTGIETGVKARELFENDWRNVMKNRGKNKPGGLQAFEKIREIKALPEALAKELKTLEQQLAMAEQRKQGKEPETTVDLIIQIADLKKELGSRSAFAVIADREEKERIEALERKISGLEKQLEEMIDDRISESSLSYEELVKAVEAKKEELDTAKTNAEKTNLAGTLAALTALDLEALQSLNLDPKRNFQMLSSYIVTILPFVSSDYKDEITGLFFTPETADLLVKTAQSSETDHATLLAASDLYGFLSKENQKIIDEKLGAENPYKSNGRLVNKFATAWEKISPTLKGLSFEKFSEQSSDMHYILGSLETAFKRSFYLGLEEEQKEANTKRLETISAKLKDKENFGEGLAELEAFIKELREAETKGFQDWYQVSFGGNIDMSDIENSGMLGMKIDFPEEMQLNSISVFAGFHGAKLRMEGHEKWLASIGWDQNGPNVGLYYEFYRQQFAKDRRLSLKGGISSSMFTAGLAIANWPIALGLMLAQAAASGEATVGIPGIETSFKFGNGLFGSSTPDLAAFTPVVDAVEKRLQNSGKSNPSNSERASVNGGNSSGSEKNVAAAESTEAAKQEITASITDPETGKTFTPRISFAVMDTGGAEFSVGATQKLSESSAVIIDLSGDTQKERVDLLASLAKVVELPKDWEARGVKQIKMVLTFAGSHTEGDYDYKRILDLMGIGGGMTINFTDGSEASFKINHYDAAGSRWTYAPGYLVETRKIGGTADEVEVSGKKTIDKNWQIIGKVGVASYQTDGRKAKQETNHRVGAGYTPDSGPIDKVEATVGKNGGDTTGELVINSGNTEFTAEAGAKTTRLEIAQTLSSNGQKGKPQDVPLSSSWIAPLAKVAEQPKTVEFGVKDHTMSREDITRVLDKVRITEARLTPAGEATAVANATAEIAANTTADLLTPTDLGTSVTAGGVAEHIKLRFTDTNAGGDGMSAATYAALAVPANFNIQPKLLAPGWGSVTPTSITRTVIDKNTVEIDMVFSAVTANSGLGIRVRTTGALGTDTAITAGVTNLYAGTVN